MDWKQVYTPPFSLDESSGIYVRDKFNRIVFNRLEINPELFESIINKLNNERAQSFNAELDGCYIKVDDRRVLCIRGWGRLTGTGYGCFKLDSQNACKIQDDFGKWIVGQLKK